MSRITKIKVDLDLTVQPKQYQSMKLGVSVEIEPLKGVGDVGYINTISLEDIDVVRREISKKLLSGLHEEVERVYGRAAADYVINQAPAVEVEPRRVPVT